MDFEIIAEKAYRQEGFDKYWNLPERYAYIRLEQLYYNYKTKNIDKEKSKIEKQKIKKEYDFDIQQYKSDLEIHKEYHENRLKNTEYLINIEKAKTKDEMMINALNIIQNIVSDKSFVNRVMEKFKSIE